MKEIKSETNINGQAVEEQAVMLVSDNAIGVTNNHEDVISFVLEALAEERPVQILHGTRDALLREQQALLLIDECRASNGTTVLVPQRQNEYNLQQRNILCRDVVHRVNNIGMKPIIPSLE